MDDFDKEFVGTIDPQQLQKCPGCVCPNPNPYLCYIERHPEECSGILDEYVIEQEGGPCQCVCHDDYWEAIRDEDEEYF